MPRKKATAEELLARAESNGYKRGAHCEKDCKRNEKKHVDKTKNHQNLVLNRYVLYEIIVLPTRVRSVLTRP